MERHHTLFNTKYSFYLFQLESDLLFAERRSSGFYETRVIFQKQPFSQRNPDKNGRKQRMSTKLIQWPSCQESPSASSVAKIET